MNCTATLQNSTVRTTPGGPYLRTSQDDSRFTDYYGAPDSIVTSIGTNDSGMFETNLRDDRFLPFEGDGAISTWTLAPPPVRTFDYSTTSPTSSCTSATPPATAVSAEAQQATTAVKGQFNPSQNSPAPSWAGTVVCLRHDFPDEWFAFVNNTDTTAAFTATLTKQRFPYVVQNSTLTIDSLTLYAAPSVQPIQVLPAPDLPATQHGVNDPSKPQGDPTLTISSIDPRCAHRPPWSISLSPTTSHTRNDPPWRPIHRGSHGIPP